MEEFHGEIFPIQLKADGLGQAITYHECKVNSEAIGMP